MVLAHLLVHSQLVPHLRYLPPIPRLLAQLQQEREWDFQQVLVHLCRILVLLPHPQQEYGDFRPQLVDFPPQLVDFPPQLALHLAVAQVLANLSAHREWDFRPQLALDLAVAALFWQPPLLQAPGLTNLLMLLPMKRLSRLTTPWLASTLPSAPYS